MTDDEQTPESNDTDPRRMPARTGPRAPDQRYFAPATERNQEPILAVLKDYLPETGSVLEIASGTGQHVAAFAQVFPGIQWVPSEPSPGGRDSVAAWVKQAGVDNVGAPLDLETTRSRWHAGLDADSFAALLAINLIHIAPWEATEGLLTGAGMLLESGGFLYLYGPYRRGGEHTAPSNAAFDAKLQEENPAWGVRDIADVETTAAAHGLRLEAVVDMPVNNLSLILRKD